MIRVLIVDDSATLRRSLREALEQAADITVVGEANDPYEARELIVELGPDVLTLDVHMPRMDGLTFLSKLMEHHPMPVVMLSSRTRQGSEEGMRALRLGAVSVVPKPDSREEAPRTLRALVHAIRAAASVKRPERACLGAGSEMTAVTATDLSGARDRVIAIGASTGGTGAIEAVLRRLPADVPGTVIVQHMPAGFTAAFAERLDASCLMDVRECRTRETIRPGLAVIAPGGHHLVLRGGNGSYSAEVCDGPQVHHQRPAVDVLFHSVARCAGPTGVGVLLTGMGADGAAGLLRMREAGAATLAQDEESCVVFGMPKKAIQVGAAEEVVHLDHMSQAIVDALARRCPG